MSATLSSASTEYVKVPVYGRREGRAIDPTTSDVFLAFLTDPDATPDAGDWEVAEWETAGRTHFARVLVGPDGLVLAPGVFYVWARVDQDEEIPVKRSDTLTIT